MRHRPSSSLLVLSVLLLATTARAADRLPADGGLPCRQVVPSGLPTLLAPAVVGPDLLEEPEDALPLPGGTVSAPLSRPKALLPLYASYAALQGLDLITTARALERGGVEGNPVMAGVAGNRAGLLAMKASASVGTIYLAEKLWKRNRMAAVALMAALNGAYLVIAVHNYRVGSR